MIPIIELFFLLLAVLLIGLLVTQVLIPIFTNGKILWLFRKSPIHELKRERQGLEVEKVRSEVLDVQEEKLSQMQTNQERRSILDRLLRKMTGRSRSRPDQPAQQANK